ncbi:hypothetical protein MSIMFB_05676 [Mycobacterium simulans]|uniref:Uncharacterized protein n=1 Tax=Mycobacterium simulans TaxID=627089 RepID=A0A7Z7IQX4_9MYCO|nr:hypothetical protein MSIMFB_05676 [Mycobacterium simulans]
MIGGAGDHQCGGAVDRGHRDLGIVGQQCGQLGVAGRDGHHGPRLAGLHQSAAGADQDRGIGQRHHPGDVGGGEFSDRVTHQVVRADPGVGEQGMHRYPEGKQGGLGVGGVVEQLGGGGVGVGEHHLGQRDLQVGVEGRAYLVEGFGKDPVVGVEPGGHARVLGALAGKDEHRFAGLVGLVVVVGHPGMRLVGG